MKIGMLTLYDQAFEAVAGRTLPNKQWYADRQRYPLIVERALIDPARNGSWNKIPALEKHLPRFDWLFWMDIDSLIANPEVRLESLIDLTKNVVFPTDSGREGGFPGNAPGEPHINASHFLIRNCPWSGRSWTASVTSGWLSVPSPEIDPWLRLLPTAIRRSCVDCSPCW